MISGLSFSMSSQQKSDTTKTIGKPLKVIIKNDTLLAFNKKQIDDIIILLRDKEMNDKILTQVCYQNTIYKDLNDLLRMKCDTLSSEILLYVDLKNNLNEQIILKNDIINILTQNEKKLIKKNKIKNNIIIGNLILTIILVLLWKI